MMTGINGRARYQRGHLGGARLTKPGQLARDPPVLLPVRQPQTDHARRSCALIWLKR